MSYRLLSIDGTRSLWPDLYQILLIILLQEFIKLNVNTDMMIKNVELAEL